MEISLMHWALSIKDTNALPWMLLEMIIYLVLLMYRFSSGILRARKQGSVAKEEDSKEKGLCNNNKDH